MYEEVKQFASWLVRGYKLSLYDDLKLLEELRVLDRYFSIRTTVMDYRITMADLYLLSGLKRNDKFTPELQAKHTNLARWIDWVQGLLGVEYFLITKM